MRIVNEEKQVLINDNQALHQQNNDLSFEFATLERDMKDFMCFRQGQDPSQFGGNPDPVA